MAEGNQRAVEVLDCCGRTVSRGKWMVLAVAVACSATPSQQPAAAPTAPAASSSGAVEALAPGVPPETPAGCPVQAATTQLCFNTKEEACASMGCPADRCTYLYAASAASVVACDD